jgi:transposase-like protein
MIKNGTDYKGSQKYHCHQCGGYGTLDAKARYSQSEKERVLTAYQERVTQGRERHPAHLWGRSQNLIGLD